MDDKNTQPRIKSLFMWLGMAATLIMGYIGTNGTAAIGGNSRLDTAVLWVCGIIAVLAQMNNPTSKTDF